MSRLLLIYDGGCGFCRRCVRYLLARDLRGVLEPLPNDAAGAVERSRVSRGELAEKVWLIDERTGRRWSGAGALNRSLRALGGPWWVAGALGTLPGLAQLEAAAYHAVAAHRSVLSRLWSAPPPAI